MKWVKTLFGYYETYHGYGRPLLKHIGIIGALTYVVFYLIRFTKPNPRPFDDLGMRLLVVILFTILALRDQWPVRLKPYYIIYSYWALIYCLPFFNVFLSLKRNGGIPAISNCFIALSFLVMLTDWRNTIIMLLSGIGLATVAYMLITPNPAVPKDLMAQLPAYLVILVGGAAFKLSEKQIDAEKLRVGNALAGSIAHEIRTPLSIVTMGLGGIESVLPGGGQAMSSEGISKIRDLTHRAKTAIVRSNQVVDMILASLKSRVVDPGEFSLLAAGDVTQKAVDECYYPSPDYRRRVNVRVVNDFTFRGDETAYIFVLFNLLKNAMYYFPEYRTASLSITVNARTVVVRDTGPGVPKAVLVRLFESFMTSGKVEGTGLGLSYCKRVMQGFGGDITCESSVGNFTQFTLSFPAIPLEKVGYSIPENATNSR